MQAERAKRSFAHYYFVQDLTFTANRYGSAVAYVKFPSASEAAEALEHLHLKTIKNGPDTALLKVMVADDPKAHPGSTEPGRYATCHLAIKYDCVAKTAGARC
jgi:hypothetical protein